jgi:hypothetical protein
MPVSLGGLGHEPGLVVRRIVIGLKHCTQVQCGTLASSGHLRVYLGL